MATTQERGWPGHYVLAARCDFRRNTLVTEGTRRIVVSTVGARRDNERGPRLQVGPGRYYETMAFEALLYEPGYWDADVSRPFQFGTKCAVDHYKASADQEANEMHDGAVAATVALLERGERCES
jgi:hypothetical protein